MSETYMPPDALDRSNYMEQLLQELGWGDGTRVPLADSENQALEKSILDRQNEILELKESIIALRQKQKDLDNYKKNVVSESKENYNLLFAHKDQMEKEVKLKQLAVNEAAQIQRDIIKSNKQSQEINGRLDQLQNRSARMLKKADTLKTEVCGDRVALQEWRASLDRSDCDIVAIEQFAKKDNLKAKDMETKRQKLKQEHDRMHGKLNEIVSNLTAEEIACNKVSVQVQEAMDQRKEMMNMWTSAIENLRQRDTDIRHIREDYLVLEEEGQKLAEMCREQQAFHEQLLANNSEQDKENQQLMADLGRLRMDYERIYQENSDLDSEAQSLEGELYNARSSVAKIRSENYSIIEDQRKKDILIGRLKSKMDRLEQKLEESQDKSATAEKRSKQLEELLNEEEQYAKQLTTLQEKSMHCTYLEQQKLFALKSEIKMHSTDIKAHKAVLERLDAKKKNVENSFQLSKEAFYNICYQVETMGAQVLHMEGQVGEREYSAALANREERLKQVCARHASRVALLERHSAKLHEDMRKMARELEFKTLTYNDQLSRLRTSLLMVEGGEKEAKASRAEWRALRVEEALMRLRVAHASRALAHLEDTAYSISKQRLELDAAMSERMIEISTRNEMFSIQKRALLQDCSKLKCDIGEREQRIDQLKKRYDIFIGSLGKDESGQQVSVAYFKIKFAAERAELRERGVFLDEDIKRIEKDIQAMEATLKIMSAAHKHFVRRIQPLAEDTPEIIELKETTEEYFVQFDLLRELNKKEENLSQIVNELRSHHNMLTEKRDQLNARLAEIEKDLQTAQERVDKQQTRLNNAHDVIKVNYKRAVKLVEPTDQWRIFQISLWIGDLNEAATTAFQHLLRLSQEAPEITDRMCALLTLTEIEHYISKEQRRLKNVFDRLTPGVSVSKKVTSDFGNSVFSTSSESMHSVRSGMSGNMKRLTAFRHKLSTKLHEPKLHSDLPETVNRSTIELRVVALDFEKSLPDIGVGKSSQRFFRNPHS